MVGELLWRKRTAGSLAQRSQVVRILPGDEYTAVMTASLELLFERNEEVFAKQRLDAPPSALSERALRLVILRLVACANDELGEVHTGLFDPNRLGVLVQHP